MYVNFYLGLAMTFRESTPTRRGSETSQSSSTKSLSTGANLTNTKLCDQLGELTGSQHVVTQNGQENRSAEVHFEWIVYRAQKELGDALGV